MPKGKAFGGIVGLTTVYPGVVQVDFTIINTGNIAHDFVVLVSLGNDGLGTWYDDGYYADGGGTYATVSLDMGQQGSDFRQLNIPNDPNVTDVRAVVLKDDQTTVLDTALSTGVISVAQAVGATVSITGVA